MRPSDFSKIPLSVVIATKNEASRIAGCLKALHRFDDVWVVDSGSTDGTSGIARAYGAQSIDFKWNGAYPKKRQWILDQVPLRHDRVLFVDADEILPPALVDEISRLDWACAGYFIKGCYMFEGNLLQYGLCNKKLMLLDRRKMMFPVVDDLDLDGMGEIEGHYQPVLKPDFQSEHIGMLHSSLIHEAFEEQESWRARHIRYARWEVGMNRKKAWPCDPDPVRQKLKRLFRAVPFRPFWAFMHCYIAKQGFRDGMAGYRFARSRAWYYKKIQDFSRQ